MNNKKEFLVCNLGEPLSPSSNEAETIVVATLEIEAQNDGDIGEISQPGLSLRQILVSSIVTEVAGGCVRSAFEMLKPYLIFVAINIYKNFQ